MYSFEFIDLNNVNLEEFNSFPKKTPFTTVPWLRFISEDKDAIPKIIRITQGEELIGYFTGLVFNKLGIKFFGSPFKGWSTNYMGFDLYDYTLISSLLEPTIDFVMKETKCLYLELVDRNITTENIVSTRFQTDIVTDLEVDIDKSDEELLKSVKKDCRKYICQFESRGAYIETVVPDDEFIETLHKQLCEVFEKQNLVPPYSLEKIKICVKYLKESDMMLCLRIKEPKGEVIASFIFLGLNKKCIGWCASSTSKFQHLRPNEYIIWHGIRKFRGDLRFLTYRGRETISTNGILMKLNMLESLLLNIHF